MFKSNLGSVTGDMQTTGSHWPCIPEKKKELWDLCMSADLCLVNNTW